MPANEVLGRLPAVDLVLGQGPGRGMADLVVKRANLAHPDLMQRLAIIKTDVG